MSAEALQLEVAEFTDADHWRWRLTDAADKFLADHEVSLDPKEPKYQALYNLPAYLWQFSSPDKRDEDERRLLDEVGAWIGETVLGRNIGEKMLQHGFPPLIVRVSVPQQAERLLVIPFEIAHARGKPLGAQGVSLVFEPVVKTPPASAPIGDRLRILALFSLPPAGNPLNLRRERQMLNRLVNSLAGRAIELRVLQYGVTRDSLRDALRDGEGWDIIHFSGHGQPGALVLEKPDGKPDPISSEEIAELLRQTGRRLKLVVLSACLSAASSIQQTMSWLGIAPTRRDAGASPETEIPQQSQEAAATVARALVDKLDCAVLAMRYAVGDEFAIAFGRNLYDGLFRNRQNLPHAAQIALDAALKANVAASVLSAATPALFGAKAADLQLVPPLGAFRLPDTGFAEFPKPPEHFVGRVKAMTDASAALAIDSDKSGVLFYGMAGGGKTSCAVELAYHHRAIGRFERFVWYEAPKNEQDIEAELVTFARALERQIDGLKMVHVIDRTEDFRNWLPQLTELLKQAHILLVLDNLESLLTASGKWRDERWGLLIDAVLVPGGFSRVILTSRSRPEHLSAVEIIPIHALPLNEALLLIRELPNLRRLLDGKAPGCTRDSGRDLVRRTLRLVQGHPKLIELAEQQAADPQRLAAQLDRAEAAHGSGELDAFFRDGETRLDPTMFMDRLRGWTVGIAGTLSEAARTFFHFLCTLEENDREDWIIKANWADLWKRLSRPEPAPEIAEVLEPLVAAALVDRKPDAESGEDGFAVLIHPGVAEAERHEAGAEFQKAVDLGLAATWNTVMRTAWTAYGKSPGMGRLIVRAGLAAFPYLSRLGEWATASRMLMLVDQVDASPVTVAAALPRVRRIVAATAGTEGELSDRSALAKLLMKAGRTAEAEQQMRAIMEQAANRGEFRTASGIATDLVNLLGAAGRYDDALKIAEQRAEYTQRSGLGPWTQLVSEGLRLQILVERGEAEEVLHRVIELREHMRTLPETGEAEETIQSWNVRETTLDIGRSAAMRLKKWQQALDLNGEIRESKAVRGASALERARTRFNDYGPLTGLQRYEEARTLLLSCREVFEREDSIDALGAVLSALADVEDELSSPATAQQFEEAALRFRYIQADPSAIRVSHFNLASYLTRGKAEWRQILAHRLAAALISVAIRSGNADGYLAALVRNLQQPGAAGRAALPADFAGLCTTVEAIEGVRFRELMERLVSDSAKCDALLQRVVATALEAASKPEAQQ